MNWFYILFVLSVNSYQLDHSKRTLDFLGYQEGITWEGSLVKKIEGVPSKRKCKELCQENEMCNSFTWYQGMHGNAQKECHLKHVMPWDAKWMWECDQCFSGMFPDQNHET